MNKIIVLFPGGFKPITGAHMALAQRYAQDPNVEQVRLLIGPKDRDGITREMSAEIFNLLNSNNKIVMQPTEFDSPITAAYEYLFAMPEDATGRYAMAASTKGDDYVRTKDFIPNVDKYKTIGDKKTRKIPAGIDATEMNVNIDPELYKNGNPISASTIRQALADNDYQTFQASYPGYGEPIIKNIWQILKGQQEAVFSKQWWRDIIQEDAESAPKAEPNIIYVIGDSIATGISGFGGSVGKKVTVNTGFMQGITMVGAGPAKVLTFILELEDQLANHTVILSSGIGNNSEAKSIVTAELKKLKELNCKVILAGVEEKSATGIASNKFLSGAAKTNSVLFLGGFTPGSDKIHPKNPTDYKHLALTAVRSIGLTEGAMGEKNKEKHDAKIKKLRHYLDSNRGDSFEYDFSEFAKTVFGAPITESLLNENYITREELTELETVIDGFFKEYGIDINFQGSQTHFLDRLNDPRNEAPIYMDELKDLFHDLSDEYGDQIAQQLKNNQPTAIESDYQFDIPIHMPFMLQWNARNKMIELIPRTIKKQRRNWQANDPNDVIYRIENVQSNHKTLLTEGGAGGHMPHPYEHHSLTFGDMKEIVSRALGGYLDLEEAVTEKTDGQNIQMTWKNGQIGFARNKGTIINPMTTAELQAKFDNRGPISEAFGNAGEDLQEAFNGISADTLADIFKNGRVFANMEIIYPATKNVIAYETAVLQFHNLVEYDEAGNIVETNASGGGTVQQIIQEANAHLQKTFKIIPPQKIKIGRIENFEDQQAAFIAEIDQLRNLHNLKDTDLVTEYHKAWWGDIITTKAKEFAYAIPQDILNILIYRWAFNDKSTSITVLKKQITNPEFLTWVIEFDKQDFKRYQKQNMEPFETIFLRLGAVVLKNAENFLAVNPSNAVQEIKTELAQLSRELAQTNDIKTLDKLKVELGRIQRLGGFEAIVPSEGIVFTYRGITYKLTGAFAPVNQILGVLKYSR